MPRGDYKPLRIQDGLETFLEETKKLHNGRTIADLHEYITLGLTAVNIGKLFNYKTWEGINAVIEQYEKEKAEGVYNKAKWFKKGK